MRSGRHLRRRRGLRAGGDGAHRVRRASTRATRPACCRRCASRRAPDDHRGVHPADRRRVRRGRADEHPVRHRRRRGLRARGEPARLADGAAGLQGVRPQHGRPRHPRDVGREAGRSGAPAAPSRLLRGQGGGLPVQHVPRSRPAAGARDALHRRGAGLGRRPRTGLLQSAGGGAAAVAARGCRADHRGRTGPVSPARRGPRVLPPGLRHPGDAGTQAFLAEQGIACRPHPQAARGPAQHRGRHQERRDPAGGEHARRASRASSTTPTSARRPSDTRSRTSPPPPPRWRPRAASPRSATPWTESARCRCITPR